MEQLAQVDGNDQQVIDISVVERVISLPEVTEEILTYIPARQLFVLARINRTISNIIINWTKLQCIMDLYHIKAHPEFTPSSPLSMAPEINPYIFESLKTFGLRFDARPMFVNRILVRKGSSAVRRVLHFQATAAILLAFAIEIEKRGEH